MAYNRRRFLLSVAGGTLGLPFGHPEGEAKTALNREPLRLETTQRSDHGRAPERPLDVGLFLDVEDIFSPPEVGNDDSIKELATILTEEGLKATFLFIGDRALLLKDRGRQDVIDSLASHEVGLHTRSARHPTNPEYIAAKSWDEAVAETLKHEREGAEIIRLVFGRPCAALSSHNVYDSPHAHRTAAILDLPYVYVYPSAPPLYNLSWYAGALSFPFESPTLDGRPIRSYFEGFDDKYPNTEAFESELDRLDKHVDVCLEERQPFLTLFVYHPQLVRLVDFIDNFWCPNGVNYPKERWGLYGQPRHRTSEQVKTALGNFRRLARWIRRDPRLNPLTVSQVVEKYGQQPAVITCEELLAAARLIASSDQVLIHPRFSPAEITMGMARAQVLFSEQGRVPVSVPRDTVLGPKHSPIWHPELQGCTHQALTQLARQLIDHVTSSGHLPATLGTPLERVGVNHLYRALAESILAMQSGSPLNQIKFRRTPPCPRLASPIGICFLKAVEGELIDPDLDVNTLYRDGKLQTWTLKPAVPT
jgi:peptidoglycan/xylan/chitin deacetylase (PgdA/CDA1 family)